MQRAGMYPYALAQHESHDQQYHQLLWRMLALWMILMSFFSVVAVIMLSLLLRRKTKLTLEQRGLPTVFWRPRFLNYLHVQQREQMQQNNASEDIACLESFHRHILTMQQPQQQLRPTSITNILPRMERLGGPYGMYATVYGIRTKVIHVAHPVPAKAVLQATSTKRPGYDHFKNFCGEGVFTADGQEWKKKRKCVNQALTRPKWHQRDGSSEPEEGGAGSATSRRRRRSSLGMFGDQVEMESNRAASQAIHRFFHIDAEAKTSSTQRDIKSEKEINVLPVMQRATLGLIYRYLTHSDVTDQGNEADFDRDANTPPTETKHQEKSRRPCIGLLHNYLQSVIRIRMVILAQARSFWFLLPRWIYTYFSPMYKLEEDTMGPIRAMARRACRNAHPGSPLDTIGASPSHDYAASGVCPTNRSGHSKAMLDEAITLMFAGQDTSAATLSWTLHLLSLYPEVQDRAADEVFRLFNEATADEADEYKDSTTCEQQQRQQVQHVYITRRATSKMTYLDAVIKESMRLYPVAPFVVRCLDKDVTIPESKTTLPRGALACIWIYGLHRNRQFWNRPDDFIPERWLHNDDSTKDAGQGNGAYMPFASGPRNCLGQPIAHIVLRVMLARLLWQCQFVNTELERGIDRVRLQKQMQPGFTILPEGGVWLGVRHRNRKGKRRRKVPCSSEAREKRLDEKNSACILAQ